MSTQETVQAIRSEKEKLLKLIKDQQPSAKKRVGPQSVANQHVVQEQPVEKQPTVVEQVQMDSASTLPTNEQSEEQDTSTQKKKRGTTQMQSVHSRTDRKLILLNIHNQPVGLTKAVVKELISFLRTLVRTCDPLPSRYIGLEVYGHKMIYGHIHRKNMIFLMKRKNGLLMQLELLGEGISMI